MTAQSGYVAAGLRPCLAAVRHRPRSGTGHGVVTHWVTSAGR